MTHVHRPPTHIKVRGARVHNLKGVDVDVPLGQFVGIAGVSGSGKSSLALGVLYAEGSRRYMDALSTYTRRRLSQASRARVDEVLHVPAALALRQRPTVPGVRSTFGTATELLNHLRLLFSRVGTYRCPNWHEVPPSMAVALERPLVCPRCNVEFMGLGAEQLAFNSEGACPSCGGTGVTRVVDESKLVPDESLTIDEGAVAPWGNLMWDLMKQVCKAMGVRTDVPFSKLTPEERDIVFHGPAEKRHILYRAKKSETFAELDFTYYNAVRTVENALSKVKDEKGMRRVERYLKVGPCEDCAGTRLNGRARSVTIRGVTLAEVSALTLDGLAKWVADVPGSLPVELRPMAEAIVDGLREPLLRLQQLGLGYLSLDRASSTLSTGELQRVQLSRAVRNRTTGVLYVLDEPSIGLHPSNVDGLLKVVDDLLADGNTVVVVDHDVRVLGRADYLIEVGPASGADGGTIIAQGRVAEVGGDPASRIAPFLTGERRVRMRERAGAGSGATVREAVFEQGAIELVTRSIHTVRPLTLRIPKGKLTAVTGVSGSGKTTMVLESLIPALRAQLAGEGLPEHVVSVAAPGMRRVNLIDATPIGVNVRSTLATYSGVLDELRRSFAKTPDAERLGLRAGDFSYNTGTLRCPTCGGTGQISLDVQFLPDVDIPCPDCEGSRYASQAWEIKMPARHGVSGESEGLVSLPELMACTVSQALERLSGLRRVASRLRVLCELGLGYLTLGEATPALSGGEAQRLKLASEIGRHQDGALFVFDEPTIGLHPLDVETLLRVLQGLIGSGATVIVIEHDLDMIANADWVVDMGPGGGEEGGHIVCAGTPEDVAAEPRSVTGRYLAQELRAGG
ncbi:excinuclease ABC subunit A [Olsenella sp. oral taxon 807]|uniref:excinuclease ABC subunit A n=1 Tax=Olsenella sp. oral taxon 807 TaxID=712411 RepID=UPI000679FE3B|nr:excinuclease ABC subunit A [Olsenella sp. oral taxon 807]AKT48311.1 excinuclease ABC subunit A [Olsenella sp. oral taxon 807]